MRKAGPEARVLLVDDQAEALMPLNVILQNLGLETTLVFDGFAARRVLASRAFDLLVMDWNMPDINGAECLSFADTTLYLGKARPRPLPYVVYSGLSEKDILLPDTMFFRNVGHWPKRLPMFRLTQTILSTLEGLK